MQESSQVNVKLTSKDIKDFSISKSLQDKHRRPSLFVVVFFTSMFIFTAFLFLIPPIGGLDIKILLMSTAVYLFIMAILLSPIFVSYHVNANNYKKSPLLHYLHLYTLRDEGITISSSYGINTLKWSEISKILELNRYFSISDVLGKCYVIPKRCFDNIEHLNNFVRIMFSKIDRSKFVLHASKFNSFSPEYEKVTAIDQNQDSRELDESEPFSEIQALYKKKEILKFNYEVYYKSPGGIIISILGLWFLLSSIRMLINGDIDFSALIITFFIGLSFAILIPISLFIIISRQFKKSDMLKSPYIYKFYLDCFTVSHPSGNSRIPWGGLVKAIENKSSILLYQTTQLANILPKSAFKNNTDQLNFLRKVISEKCPKAKINI